MSKNTPSNHKVVAENRKARHNYFVEEVIECGIMLTGTEVKSLRTGKAQIAESFAGERKGELFLENSYIAEFSHGNRFNHEPRRPRKLLVHKRQMLRLLGLRQAKGKTLIPLKLYFNDKGRAKLELGVCTGKKLHDKRQTEKQRDWDRQKARALRGDF